MKHITLKLARRKGTEDVPLPCYMSEHASGMDLCAAVEEPLTIQPGDIQLIPTGIHIAIPEGFEIQVRPRSGLALKHGLIILNSPGTIDSDYRGEVKVILGNFGKEAFRVERGMRIAQMVAQQVIRADILEADALDETSRNTGGFGHTGS